MTDERRYEYIHVGDARTRDDLRGLPADGLTWRPVGGNRVLLKGSRGAVLVTINGVRHVVAMHGLRLRGRFEAIEREQREEDERSAKAKEEEIRLRQRAAEILSTQPVISEGVPVAVARLFEAEGVRTWRDVLELDEARSLTYLGIGRAGLTWIRSELSMRLGEHAPLNLAFVPRLLKLRSTDLPPRRGVYFVQCNEVVKIGLAEDVRKRVASIKQSLPYRAILLGVVAPAEGQSLRALERSFHQRFQHLRQVGEWFRHEGELAEFCAGLAAKHTHDVS